MTVRLSARPYESYVYAYPHKTAYRPLRPRPALADVWRCEDHSALSFYAHIPFCEVRCGFCNLFYTDAEAALWTEIDELFPVSRLPHASRGRACRTGESVVSVDGEGRVRRCHFVSRTEARHVLGNLYDGSFRAALRPRPCPLLQCDCHIGYVHMPELELYPVFRNGVLERVPETDMIRVCRS
jgi:hypothetical protein